MIAFKIFIYEHKKCHKQSQYLFQRLFQQSEEHIQICTYIFLILVCPFPPTIIIQQYYNSTITQKYVLCIQI